MIENSQDKQIKRNVKLSGEEIVTVKHYLYPDLGISIKAKSRAEADKKLETLINNK